MRVLDGQGGPPPSTRPPAGGGPRGGGHPLRLAVHQLLFPGWRAYLDGQPTPCRRRPTWSTSGARLESWCWRCRRGHHVEVRFGPTPPAPAEALSAARPGLAGALVYAWWHGDLARTRHDGARWALLVALPLWPAPGACCTGWWTPAPAWARPRRARRPTAGCPWPAASAGPTGWRWTWRGPWPRGGPRRRPGVAGQGPLHPFLDVRTLAPGLAPPPRPAAAGAPAGGGRAARWLYMHPPPAALGACGCPPGLLPGRPGPRPAPGARARTAGRPRWATGCASCWRRRGPPGARCCWSATSTPAPGARSGLGGRVGRPRPPGRAGGAPGAAHGGRGRPHFDWAGWANPQVVRWTGARAQPGARHQW